MLLNPKIDFEAVDHAIQGKLIACSAEVDSMYVQEVMSEEDKRYIKERLASQIAAFMMQHGLIEFTQHKDPSSSAMMIRGRVYVAPDDQVRIIRTLKR